MTAADSETLPPASCRLLISVSDSADAEDAQPLGRALFTSLCPPPPPPALAPCLLSPGPPPPPLPAAPSALCSEAASCLSWTGVCQCSGNVARQLDSICSWLFAGIQSLRLPGLDPLPNPLLLLGLEGMGGEDRGEGELASGRGYQGHMGGPWRAGSARWTGELEADFPFPPPPFPPCPSTRADFRKVRGPLLLHSLPRAGPPPSLGELTDCWTQEEALWFPRSSPVP